MLRELGARGVGPDAPVFVIAEIGLNHEGRVDQAWDLVDAAAWAGASAIKLQTLRADRLVSESCPAPAHVQAQSLREFFAAYELDASAHRVVIARARAHGLAVLSTPLSEDAIPMLLDVGVDAFKIASGDLTYDRLITVAARTGRPIVLSTGMSTMEEVRRAVLVAKDAGAQDIAVLHCVSAYPTPPRAENLRAVVALAEQLQVPVGLSDHGSGLTSAVAAATLGACIYERHLMLHRTPTVIDSAVSSTPTELKAIVAALAHTRLALGDGRKTCQPAEAANLGPSRRGLYAARALRAGECVRPDDILVLRPASRLPPSDWPLLPGAIVNRDIAAGAAFTPDDIATGAASLPDRIALGRAS